jgi:hypothetical protein
LAEAKRIMERLVEMPRKDALKMDSSPHESARKKKQTPNSITIAVK